MIPPTEFLMCPKSLWRHSRQMSESHLRTQRPKRLAEVTYGYKKETTACNSCTNLTGQMQERAIVDLCQIIPGRLPGRAICPQQKKVESKWPDPLTIDPPEGAGFREPQLRNLYQLVCGETHRTQKNTCDRVHFKQY